MHVLEEEAGVGEIERAPFLVIENEIHRIAASEIDLVEVSRFGRHFDCESDLFGASLYAEHSAGVRRSGHGATELSKPASHIEDALAAFEV